MSATTARFPLAEAKAIADEMGGGGSAVRAGCNPEMAVRP
jgi:hypothetical protein